MYNVQLVCIHVSLNSDICAQCTNVVLEYSWSPLAHLQGNKAQGGALGTGLGRGHRTCSRQAPFLLYFAIL